MPYTVHTDITADALNAALNTEGMAFTWLAHLPNSGLYTLVMESKKPIVDEQPTPNPLPEHQERPRTREASTLPADPQKPATRLRNRPTIDFKAGGKVWSMEDVVW